MGEQRHYGRVYFATEYALNDDDREIKKVEVVVHGKKQYIEREVKKENAEYSRGYRAVIWDKDGRGALYSNEAHKLHLDTTPEIAYKRLRVEAAKLAPKHGPIDLYAHGLGIVTETVGV